MTRRRTLCRAALAVAAVTAAAAVSHAQQTPSTRPAVAPSIDAGAARVLWEMSEYLRKLESFTFHVNTTYDVVQASGEKIQLAMSEDVSIKRPGSVHVNMIGDEGNGRVHCDGRTFVLYDAVANTYARTDVPNDLGLALDHVWEEFAMEVPVADIAYPDPYAVLTENVETGRHIGKHLVGDVVCDHLAFTQETIDWQIWIEDGHQRVPRKLVITYKQRPGEPQYMAVVSKWKLNPRLSAHIFRFDPPEGAHEIEFLQVYDVFPSDGDEQ